MEPCTRWRESEERAPVTGTWGRCAGLAVRLLELGRTRYDEALALQRRLQAERKEGRAPDTLLLTEHEPVVTLGRNAGLDHLLVPPAELAARGITLVRVERGGDITYHGPGQLVAYPILDLAAFGRDVRRYIWRLEETALRLLSRFGVRGERRPGTPGVWVGARKIASVGVSISRWVTMHGIAINVDMDLTPFTLIHPCGLAGLEMTTLAHECGRHVPLEEAVQAYREAFAAVFGCRLVPAAASNIAP